MQKNGKTTFVRERVMYGILIVLIALSGCIITYGLKDSGRIDWSDIWREDTYYTLVFSFIGAMAGQFFEAGKEKQIRFK